MKKAQLTQVFAALGLCGFCAIMSVVASVANGAILLEQIPGWLVQAMSLYLIFIFARTGAHLMFSFLWGAGRSAQNHDIQHFPLVSVIIPCFQEELVIEKAMRSITELDYPNLEFIVVDDGSTDMTFTKVNEFISSASIRIIFQKNAGKAAALNRGISEASGEFVLCVDADSYIEPASVKEGITHLLSNPKIAAVAGNVKVGNTRGLIAAFQKLEYMMALNFLKIAQSFFGSVTVVPGPAGLFRRSVLVEIGGYNSHTFAEDCDLTIRILLAGHKVVYEPNMVAVTEAPTRFSALTKQRYRWSRGIVQAIKMNSEWLFRPRGRYKNFFLMWYMVIESIMIPACNYLFAVTTILFALNTESNVVVGFYFFQLIILDVVVATYSLIASQLSMKLLILATFSRFTYGLALEVQRFYSILDEVLALPMKWNKLQRKGIK